MLQIRKDEKSSPVKITLSGVIDETTNFEQALGKLPPAIQLNCREVSRINSVGIKLWREFFDRYRKGGGKAKFQELSPALVTTINYIADFIQRQEIETLCAPYHCQKCDTITLAVLKADEAKAKIQTASSQKCSKCGGTAELDEVADEYFSFL